MTEKQKGKSILLSPLVVEDGVMVEFRIDHIHVRLGKGLKVSSEQRNVLWGRIASLCEENGTHRVLVEGKAPEGIFQTSEVIDAGLKAATVPKLWMAFCFENFKPDELSQLYETVAASRGVRVKHFLNATAALNWLRTNTPA